jgi:hypothetical protein
MSTGPTYLSRAHSYRRRAALYEAGIWRSLYQWLTRGHRSNDRDAVRRPSPFRARRNIEVVFHEPVTVRFINRHANVDTIRSYADAPTALLAATHAQLADSPGGRVDRQPDRTPNWQKRFVVFSRNRPQAVVLDIDEYERLLQSRGRADTRDAA